MHAMYATCACLGVLYATSTVSFNSDSYKNGPAKHPNDDCLQCLDHAYVPLYHVQARWLTTDSNLSCLEAATRCSFSLYGVSAAPFSYRRWKCLLRRRLGSGFRPDDSPGELCRGTGRESIHSHWICHELPGRVSVVYTATNALTFVLPLAPWKASTSGKTPLPKPQRLQVLSASHTRSSATSSKCIALD
jgi:hypothetical protein